MKLLYYDHIQHRASNEHLDCIKFQQPVRLCQLRIIDSMDTLPHPSLTNIKVKTEPSSFKIEVYARAYDKDVSTFEKISPSFEYNMKRGVRSCSLNSNVSNLQSNAYRQL